MTILRYCCDWESLAKCLPDGYFDHVIMDPDYYSRLNVTELRRISKGNIIVFGLPAYRYPNFLPDEILHWVKPISTKNTVKKMSNFVEEILVMRRGTIYNHDMQWANYCGLFTDIVEGVVVHPYQKPLSLIERLVRVYTNAGETIFDGTMGSGTTLKACDRLGRHALGCETDLEIFKLSEGIGS